MKHGKHLFTFALIADSHVTEAELRKSGEVDISFDDSGQELGNARSRFVVQAVNRINPDFVIHLGDLTHPIPREAGYADSAQQFHDVYSELTSPLHLVPGNHDIGEKVFSAVLGGQSTYTIDEDMIAEYEREFQPQYFSFEHQDCLFVVINAMIFNSGLESETAQRAWLEKLLADNQGRRTFVFSHYPPFLAEPGETQHYDAIDEPCRSWLLGLMDDHKVEAYYAGHVHNYFFNRHGATNYYVLPSVCFLRHDYHAFFRVAPEHDQGRNDAAKLGYAVVDVYENGHVNRIHRTYGEALRRGEDLPPEPHRLPAIGRSGTPAGSLGISLIDPWCEYTDVRTPWGLDAFRRKFLRNDYPLLALDEMAVSKLRVPIDDLLDERTRTRMVDFKATGFKFTVYSFGAPNEAQLAAMTAHGGLVDAWEVVAPVIDAGDVIKSVGKTADGSLPRILFNPYRTEVEAISTSHGLPVDEPGLVETLLAMEGARGILHGVVFGLAWDQLVTPSILKAIKTVEASGIAACIHVEFTRDTAYPDENLYDLNRLAETVSVAAACPGATVFVDNFTGIDRGYMFRHGLVILFFVSAIFAPVFATHDPFQMDIPQRMSGPTAEHWLGTDQLGRDTYTRVLYGGRVALQVAAIGVSISLAVGLLLGMLAGFGPRWLDNILLLLFDAIRSFPTIVLALAAVALLGPSLNLVLAIVIITSIPGYARLARTSTLALKNTEFILAEQSLGASMARTLWKHIMPNVIGPLLILAAMDVPVVVTIEAGLSFLGLGVLPPTASWGTILNEGYLIIRDTPWPVIAGGIPLVLTTLGFTFLGEALRDVFDPKLRKGH